MVVDGLKQEDIKMETELFSDLPSYVSATDPYEFEKEKLNWRKYKAKFLRVIGILSLLSFLGAFSWRAYKKAEFDAGCTDNLMYAAKTATLPQARISIFRATEYLKKNKLMWGDTNLFFETDESNDLNAFNGKLLTLYDHIDHAEQTYAIHEYDSEVDVDLKLSSVNRSLITTKFGSEEIIKPEGIEHYPYHLASFLWLWISAITASVFLFISNHLTPKK